MQTPPHSCELYSVFINGRKEPKAWVGVQITRLQLPHLTRHDTHTHKTKLSFPFFPLASVPLGGGSGILTQTNGGRIFCWFRPWLQSFSSNPRPSPKTSEIKPGKTISRLPLVHAWCGFKSRLDRQAPRLPLSQL